MTNYDIFISYRREGGYDTAKHLYDLLQRDGYKVSFDIDTLRNGFFDDELLKRIDECIDFLLIVDKHCFDRINHTSYRCENDWLRRELAYALKKNKNIIPIFLHGVNEFPDNLPPDISGVIRRNGPHIVREYFDEFYNKLKTRYLDTKPPQLKYRNNSIKTIGVRPEIKEVKLSFVSNIPCSIYANGASCCSIGQTLSAVKYLYPGEYIFKCISKSDSSNIQTIKYNVKNITGPQSIKIEFEPSALDIGITQEQYANWKKIHPGYNTSVDKGMILASLKSQERIEEIRKNEALKENTKVVFTIIGVIILIAIAVIMISCGIPFLLALGVCSGIGTGIGKAAGIIK